jgi:hypothetical protein
MAESQLRRVRDALAGASLPVSDSDNLADNLAIALCSYFKGHLDRPEDDEHDDENGWSEWTVQQTNSALERLARAAILALE